MRAMLIMLATAFLIWLLVISTARGVDRHRRVVGHGQVRFDGHGPEWWARAWRREHRSLLQT